MFNPNTNRIINGICEYCGIPASTCEHYKDGQSKPLDETKRLEIAETAPRMTAVPIEPLKAEEKAASVAEAKAKMEEVVAKENAVEGTIELKKRGRTKK